MNRILPLLARPVHRKPLAEARLATKTRRRLIANAFCTPLRLQGTGALATHAILNARDATGRRTAREMQRRRQIEREARDRLTAALQQARAAHEAMRAILNETLTAAGAT